MSTESVEKKMDSIGKMVSFDEIVDIAKKITNDNFVRVLEYSLNDYSEDKLGFTASHHILRITVQKYNQSTESRETISAFVKIVSLPVLDGSDENIDINRMIIDRETFFLKTLVSQFTDNYKSEKWWPMHYYTTKNIIIMEDLKSNGYKILEQIIDNYTILESVLASLARFHSCSILTEGRMSRDSKRPTALNENYKDRFPEIMFLRRGEENNWFSLTTKLACALAEHFGYDPKTVRDLFDRMCDLVKPSEVHRNAVCHGDVHSKNLMFADDDSSIPQCTLIDFQTFRYAPLVTDILQFLHINTSRKFREEHEPKLIEFYHSVLKESIESNDSTKMAEIPTLEDISKGMEDMRLFGLVNACTYHPILFLDPELTKKHARDAEFNENIVSGDLIDLTFAHMKVNELYRNQLEEDFCELVEKST